MTKRTLIKNEESYGQLVRFDISKAKVKTVIVVLWLGLRRKVGIKEDVSRNLNKKESAKRSVNLWLGRKLVYKEKVKTKIRTSSLLIGHDIVVSFYIIRHHQPIT